MKTKNLTLFVAVAAAAAFSSPTMNAAEPYLSPRAQANRIMTISGSTGDQLERGPLSGSPKGREQRIHVVSGVSVAPVLPGCQSDVAASPRALTSFPWLAQSGMCCAGKPGLTQTCHH